MPKQWVYDLAFGKTGTPTQFRAAKLSGAKRAFRLGLFVGILMPYYTTGRVEDYRLVNSGKDVEIKVNGHWFPKHIITKNPKVIKAILHKKERK